VINLVILIINPGIILSFATGVSITLIVLYLYFRFLKQKFNSLHNISEISSNDSVPIFTLLNNLPDNVYIKDIFGKYIIANDSFAHLLKLSNASKLIGKSDSDIYPPEIAQKYNDEDKLVLGGELPVFTREQKSDKNGTTKFTITTKVPLKNKSGKIIGLVGICTDNTEQKSATVELLRQNSVLEQERKLLRALMDNMPETIYIKDRNGCFLDVNPEQVAVTKGASREEMIGKSDYDYYPKDIADIFFKDDKHIIETGAPVINKEEIGFDPEGNIRVKLTTKVPFFDENGNVAGLVGIGHDITKLKETEEKLIEQAQNLQEINVLLEERQEEINQQSDELSEQNRLLEKERTLLRTLIDSIPDFVYIKDRNSKYITANKNLLDNFEISDLDLIVEKSDFDFYPKEMAQKFLADEEKIISTGNELVGIEETGIDKNGNIIHMLTTKVPFRSYDGHIEGIVGITRNITTLKETELKLIEQADYLKEVNVLLEERQEEIQQQSSELSNQNKLLENERNLLRVLIDNIPESIFIKDTESRFVMGNKTLMKSLNVHSIEEFEGKSDFDFYERKLALDFFEDERKIFESKKPVLNKEEYRYLKDGNIKIKSSTKVPYFDEDGRILGIVGISNDITDLKDIQKKLEIQANDLQEANQLLEERAEEIQKQSESLVEQNSALEKERTLLRTLIDNMPDYIYIKDAFSRFITVNKRMLETLHVDSLDDIIGKTDFDLTPSMTAAQEYYTDELNILKTGKALINKEEIGWDKFGKERVISTTKVPFRDVDNKILGIVGIGRDITKQKNNERKLIEQADSLKEVNALLQERQERIQLQSGELNKQAEYLKKANKQLEELNATKNKFFSIIAHDLKNPFQAIFGFSELLMRNFDDFEEKQRIELLSMIKASSESAYNLLENLLQWARTQTDRIKYNPAQINIHDIIQQNVVLIQATAEKKKINVQPELLCGGNAWADFNMINLVIRNLLSNALKFTPDNGTVTIKCLESHGKICKISISDTGIGISEDNIKKLFKIDEYFSTSGTAGESGTGLGLIICREFIEKNQGELIVESKLDYGTTFSFTLPLTEK
jgi:PAS domain S-box-containing protein